MNATQQFISSIQKRWIWTILLLVSILVVDAILMGIALNAVQTNTSAMNTVGRQKMLVDRSSVVTRFFVRAAEDAEREHVRGVMLRAVELMNQNHAELTAQMQKVRPSGIRKIFLQPPFNLQERFENFVSHFRELAAAAPSELTTSNPHYTYIMQALNEGDLFETLSLAERKYREASEESLDRLINLAQSMFAANFLIILMIGIFVLRPMLKKVREETGKLQAANTELENRTRELESSRRAALNIMEDAQDARWQAEKAQQRLHLVIESAPNAILMFAMNGEVVLANEGAEELLGWSREQILQHQIFQFLAAGDREMLRVFLSEEDEPLRWTREVRIVNASGESIPVEMIVNLMEMEKRRFALASLTDLTERKHAETLRASEERFRGVIQQAAEGLFLVDREGVFAEVNARACRMLGYERQELLSLSFWDINPLHDSLLYSRWFEEMEAGVPKTLESTLRRRDKTVFPVEMHASLIDLHGRSFLLVFARDITERKDAEREVREMSLALQHAVEGISRFDAEGHCVMANRAFTDMLDYAGEGVRGMAFTDFIYADDQRLLPEARQRMAGEGKSELKIRMVRRDNSVFNGHLMLVKTMEDRGRDSGFYCFLKDVTEQRYRESLDIKSELISVVAHELRTPLHSVREGISVMLEGLTGDINDDQEDVLRTTKSSLDRLVRLVNSVLDFQRLEAGIIEFHFQPTQVNRLLTEAFKSIQSLLKNKGLEGRLVLEDRLPEVVCDRDRIMQVLVNLLNNAVKFTESGRIVLRSEFLDGMAKVTVEDTGIGIKEGDLPRLFRKFGQLESGKVLAPGGAGLGLIISKKIIQEHGGNIFVISRYRQGSTFSFTLPVPATLEKVTSGHAPHEKNNSGC